MQKRLPTGISDFKKIIEDDYAYIDKTLLVAELIEKGGEVALIPRLRRFGKTLNLSMLRYFFEKRKDSVGYLFKGLNIWKSEKYRKLQGKFPVIFITLKDVKQASWDDTFALLKSLIAREFERHRYIAKGKFLTPKEKELYNKIVFETCDKTLLEQSLSLLSEWLHRYHKERVVLLIDEYDTPAHAAFVGNFYDELIGFLRNWLSGVLKDNVHLEHGVLTGILRIAKESIFSGLNNVNTFTLLDDIFCDKFGLTESEVKALLSSYNLSEKLDDVRQWYNGYRIGSCSGIYNPWSVLNYIAKSGKLAPYWVNTSENTLMKQLITQGTNEFKIDLEQLLKGGVIDIEVEEGIVFPELHHNPTAIWSLLLYCGYLTLDEAPSYGTPCRLRIPNLEVKELYRSMILNWFEQSIHRDNYRMLLNSLTSGDVDVFSRIFQEFMRSSVSVFDVPAEESEKIYHGFVLGMLIGLGDRYEVKSNRESGFGRYDVMVIPKDPKELGIIMEFKKVDRFEKSTLEEAVVSALSQIETKHYAQELKDRGIHRILYLGFAFRGKDVLIRSKFHPPLPPVRNKH
jgi:hypothetical protein